VKQAYEKIAKYSYSFQYKMLLYQKYIHFFDHPVNAFMLEHSKQRYFQF